MSIIFGFIGLLFMLVILVASLFFVIFMARKIGLIKPPEEGDETPNNTVRKYLTDFKKVSHSLLFKFGLIAILIGIMTIPQDMVSSIVDERSRLYASAIHKIANSWGHKQHVKGPALLIPYTEKFNSIVYKTDLNGVDRKINKVRYEKRTAIILPDDLNISANIHGETRKISLYEALVYSADLNISGSFQRPDLHKLSDHIDKIHWDRAWLALGISDTQAINKVSQLHWDMDKTSSKIDFEPGTVIVDTLPSGFHATLNLKPDNTKHTKHTNNTAGSDAIDENSDDSVIKTKENKRLYRFSLNLNINGSNGFYFTPFGKTTDVQITSDWPHPSFQGSVLPNKHNISSEGFVANWSIPHLARNYPQIWTLETQKFDIKEFQAGVNLFETVSHYSQITRAIKYSILFLTLTYITFLIFELGIGRRLHIVQYAIIGLALSMFYLVLLSMAEHTVFFNAYLSAAAIIIVMISLYAYSAIRSISRTSLIGVLLIGLYTLLYSLLKLEDFALLAGTSLLLVILGILMYMTRNIGKEKKLLQ